MKFQSQSHRRVCTRIYLTTDQSSLLIYSISLPGPGPGTGYSINDPRTTGRPTLSRVSNLYILYSTLRYELWKLETLILRGGIAASPSGPADLSAPHI